MSPVDHGRRLEARVYERLTFLRAVHIIVSFALVLTFGAALLVRLIEPQTFRSFGDASWWASATVSTTGYGDLSPQTLPGRVVGAFVMVCALAWVPAVTAIVTTLHLRRREERRGAYRTPPTDQADSRDMAVRLERIERLLEAALSSPVPASRTSAHDQRSSDS
jgi:voltage-gated potassium channel